MISMISGSDIGFPDISMAFVGHTLAHSPHIVQRVVSVVIPWLVRVIAFSGQTATQVPHLMHFAGEYIFSGLPKILSGLWHQAQCRLHPLKKTTSLIPGPSLMA
jgi:hypothetical protein